MELIIQGIELCVARHGPNYIYIVLCRCRFVVYGQTFPENICKESERARFLSALQLKEYQMERSKVALYTIVHLVQVNMFNICLYDCSLPAVITFIQDLTSTITQPRRTLTFPPQRQFIDTCH